MSTTATATRPQSQPPLQPSPAVTQQTQSIACAYSPHVAGEAGLKPPEASTGPEAWQGAVDLTGRGDGKQRQGDYAGALECYNCAVAYYARALSSTEDVLLTPERKAVIRDQLRGTQLKVDALQRAAAGATGTPACCGSQIMQPAASSVSTLGRGTPMNPTKSLLSSSSLGGVASSSSSSSSVCDDCVCWACRRPMESTMSALGHMWHPQCFISNVHCGFCGKPFSLLDLRFVVGKEDGKPYHVTCRDYTLGLCQHVEKTFVGATGTMFVQVALRERRMFRAGENIGVEVVVDNNSTVKLMSFKALVIREEARSERRAGGAGERCEGKAVTTAVICVESNLGKKLPLGVGRLSETVLVPLGADVQGSVLGDCAFRREYRLKTRCIISGLHNSIDMEFPIIIDAPHN